MNGRLQQAGRRCRVGLRLFDSAFLAISRISQLSKSVMKRDADRHPEKDSGISGSDHDTVKGSCGAGMPRRLDCGWRPTGLCGYVAMCSDIDVPLQARRFADSPHDCGSDVEQSARPTRSNSSIESREFLGSVDNWTMPFLPGGQGLRHASMPLELFRKYVA